MYGSRLLGAEPLLVLHGGGNTSVKVPGVGLLGDPMDILWVKGSGYDMASITEEGFAPLDLCRVAGLCGLDRLTDTEMMNALMCMRLSATAPAPSVEAILHAVIPRTAVQHSHADAVLALTDTRDGEELARQVFGPLVLVLPYVMPGFPLARACAELIAAELEHDTVGIVLVKHGIFTFADDTRSAYKSMIELVGAAESYVASRRRHRSDPGPPPRVDRGRLAQLRADLSAAAGRPLLVGSCSSPATLRLAGEAGLQDAARRGPITPDHVLRTKRAPLVGLDVAGYAGDYRRMFETESSRHAESLVMLDPAPRIVVDPCLGVWAAGPSVRELAVAGDIYLHTAAVIEDAEDLGGYEPVSPEDCFDMEYWELEQAKLALEGRPKAHAGEVALVTGAASGIGLAVAGALLAQGAAVVGVDLAPVSELCAADPGFVSVTGDVCDPEVVERALDQA
ncbi:MAG: SDR family NAD(P)-dependent oxidoreductase, partial [Acidimicrobiales bacterium]